MLQHVVRQHVKQFVGYKVSKENLTMKEETLKLQYMQEHV